MVYYVSGKTKTYVAWLFFYKSTSSMPEGT